MEKFGINPKNAYVFGDSSNDLAMFQFVEHAVAMGNHDPVLDPYAEFCNEDGGRGWNRLCNGTLWSD